MVNPTSIIVGEDGSASGNIEVTKTGYSFGEVSFSLIPLTYSEYTSEVEDTSVEEEQNLDTLFPLHPITPASGMTMGNLVSVARVTSFICRLQSVNS